LAPLKKLYLENFTAEDAEIAAHFFENLWKTSVSFASQRPLRFNLCFFSKSIIDLCVNL